MRLRCEVVDLVRLGFLYDADDVGRVGHIAVVQLEGHPLLMWIVNQVVNALSVEGRRTALHAVDEISLRKQKFGKIGAILPGCAGDQRRLPRRSSHHRLSPRIPFIRSSASPERFTPPRSAERHEGATE